MARVLVTGGAGFVGLPLCRELSRLGHEVTVLDDGTSGQDRCDAVSALAVLRRVDVTDEGATQAAVSGAEPEVVIHLAALHFIPDCNRRPADAVRINVVGTQSVLDACVRTPSVKRVLITSSAAVYPISDEALPESHPVGPTDIYGATKAVNEWQAQRFAERTDVSTVAVRLFNVFGPGETNPHVVPEIIDQLRAGRRCIALGNVAPKRSYVYMDDVVSGFVALAAAPSLPGFSVFNLGNRDEASVSDLIQMAATALNVDLEIESDAARTRPSDRPFLRCNDRAISDRLGWSAETTVQEGMRRLLIHEGLV